MLEYLTAHPPFATTVKLPVIRYLYGSTVGPTLLSVVGQEFSTADRCFYLSTVLPPLYRVSTSLPCVHLSTACPPWIHGGITSTVMRCLGTSGNLNIVLSIVL